MMHLLLLCANIKHTMKIILFDDKSWGTLRPLTFTRPISELRVGILTIREKWEKRFGDKVAYLTKDYLQEKFPLSVEDDNLLINSSVCPNDAENQFFTGRRDVIAGRLSDRRADGYTGCCNL